MVAKIQQLDKTVVTEIKIQVADINIRQNHMKGAFSAKIPQTSPFVQADTTVTDTLPAVLDNINVVVAIQCWQPVVLELQSLSGTISQVPCTGLFVVHGKFSRITVRGTTPVGTRISYLYA